MRLPFAARAFLCILPRRQASTSSTLPASRLSITHLDDGEDEGNGIPQIIPSPMLPGAGPWHMPTRYRTISLVRIDKWMWAARFFKTRALAVKACELGRVTANGAPAKPAREIKVGDTLSITTEGGLFGVEVLGLSELRGPASTAQALYRETDESKSNRARATEDRKLLAQWEVLPVVKPKGRDRRVLNRFRGKG